MSQLPELEMSWSAIVLWCQQHAPATAAALRGPAGPEALDAAEVATGGAWPNEMRRWYALHDGGTESPYAQVLPRWLPLSLEGVVETWQRWREVVGGLVEDGLYTPGQVQEAEEAPAGEPAGIFVSSFVPIGTNLSAWELFVDVRPGPRRGCVGEWQREDGDGPPRWSSIQVMLAEVAASLVTGQSCGRDRPVVVDGELTWDRLPVGRRS